MHDRERWPGRPSLLPDESFSSWFARTAAANGLRPRELYGLLRPGGDRNIRDLDRHADPHVVHRLAESTGHDDSDLTLGTFRRWAGLVFDEDDGLKKFYWVAPAGRDGARRCFGQQLCPGCLRDDPVPYLRLTWRLGFVTTCPIHGQLLLDRCQTCNEPFSALRQDGGVCCCQSCGSDVRRMAGDMPLVDAAPVREELLAALKHGWFALGTYGPLYSFLALEILGLVMQRLAGGRHAYALRTWVAKQDRHLAVAPEVIPRAHDSALLTPRARNVLVSMAYWLITDWPHRFVAAARSAGMTSTDLRKQPAAEYPFAYVDAIESHLKKPHKGSGRAEVEAASATMRKHGRPVTYRNLTELFGTKLGAMRDLAEPAAEGFAEWGKGRYWKVDGVSPEVKAAVRAAAHGAGAGVGTWLEALLRRELSLPLQPLTAGTLRNNAHDQRPQL